MERVLQAFMRVQRSLDDGPSLTVSFPTMETKALTDPSSLSDPERRQILDFPDAAAQQQNITASSMLPKHDLLKRAAQFPNQLTDAEIKLLRNRYWANVKFCEEAALPSAYLALEGRWKEVEERLKRVRADLYEENEEAAIANADEEDFRRGQESEDLSQKQDLEKSFQLAHPWIRQLWEQDLDRDRGRPPWGYAVYESPDMAPNADVKGEFRGWLENVLFHAAGALCCGSTIGARWRLQRLEWPVASTSDDGMKSNGLEEE